MKKKSMFSKRHFLPGIVVLLASASASAQTLSELVELARTSEPTFLGAQAMVAAAQARSDQAFGGLMPQISATANTNYNRRDYHTRMEDTPTVNDDYNSNGYQVSITQPLWRRANTVGYRQSEAQLLQAQQQMSSTDQELLARLVSAWLETLSAQDNVKFTAQQEVAARKEWKMAKRGLELGTTGQPLTEEARAKYDAARADAVAAIDEAQGKLANLELLVGPLSEFKSMAMTDEAVLPDLSTDTLEHWLGLIETSSPSVRAARHAFEAADAEVSKQRAGHQPTLDLVANYGKNSQAVGGFPGQAGYDIKTNSVGLQLNVPLFSGGTQSAKVSEAVAMKEKARLDIEAARRAAAVTVKQAWYGWRAARVRAEAGRQSVRAADAALRLARKGNRSGVKMDLDVLQAEQQYWGAQRDWRKGRYDQLAAHVKLKSAVGALTLEDVSGLDRLFLPEQQGAEMQVGMLHGETVVQGDGL